MKYTITAFYPPGDNKSYSYHPVRLLEAGLVELGHDVHVINDALEPGRRNILVGAHKLNGDMGKDIARFDCVVLQTEMLTGGWMSEERVREHYVPVLAFARRVWEWVDVRNVADLGTWGIERVPMLLPGQHAWLREIHRSREKDVPIVFMGSLNDARAALFCELKHAGMEVAVLPADIGRPQRSNILGRARCMICPTDGALGYFTAARVAYAVNNGIPCVIERPQHNPWPGCGVVVDRGDIVETCRRICESSAAAESVATAASDAIPMFVDNLREVIDA